MVTDSEVLERLPSLPQVLLRILDAIHSERADFQRIADIIRHDTAMTVRLLGVANSSYYGRAKSCQTVERALLFLGTDTVKTIVITASIKQFFSRFNPHHQPFVKAFWRRSLIAANFSHILANLTGYKAADEAYLCGLLMDVGQLVLLNRDDRRYLECWAGAGDDRALIAVECEHFQHSHADVGADLVESWEIGGFMADALRYHHEPGAQILDAHHLVKIVNLASLLSAPGQIGDEAFRQADQLFGLNEALTRELLSRISADVTRIASSLNIDIGDNTEQRDISAARTLLGERLSDLSQFSQVNGELWRSHSLAALEQTVRRIVYITLGVEHCLLFTVQRGQQEAVAHLPEAADDPAAEPAFAVPLLAGRSLVSDALLQGRIIHSAADGAAQLAVVDRQLLKHCRADALVCLPLTVDSDNIGVLVLGLDQNTEDPQIARPTLLTALCSEIARAIRHQSAPVATDGGVSGEQLQQKIREAVHEAGNPLSIIRNYMEMLRIKLGENHQVNDDLELIKQEIDRVGAILLRLREPEENVTSDGSIDLNRLVGDVARIFEQSLCATRQITLQLQLAETLPPVKSNVAHLQQILTNLLKNAVEALPSGGHAKVTTSGGVIVNGRNFAEITIEDDGPGIPEPVMRQLFAPTTSGKGAGHSGLGLSITKKLMDELGGSIVCKSSRAGTQFQLLIPLNSS
jgi:HD-like signal output (HDOD) protein/two-component sensor histidine kinase